MSATMLSWATPVVAQDASSADNVGDIIVTARRVEERLQDVPISITVMNQQTLADRNITNAAQLSIYTPSLSTNSRYGPEQASFTIRGFYQEQGTAPSVGVYFGDVVLPRASGTIVTAQGGGPGLLFDLQNVQVLKGPQGTLQGRNTTGGAILIVPQKPTDKLEGYVEGSIGNYDMRRVQAVINVPLADTFKVRLGVDRQKRDGYLRNMSGIGPNRLADTDYVAARMSIVADLAPDLENYTIVSYSKSDTNGSGLRVLACNRSLANLYNSNPQTFAALGLFDMGCDQVDRQNARGDGFWDIENSAPDAEYRSRQWQVINTTAWTASDSLTVKNIISYGEVRAYASASLFGDNLIAVGPGFSVPVPTLIYRNGRFGPSSSQSTFTEEFRLQGNAMGGRLDWQAGAYFELAKPLGFNSQLTQIFATCTDVTKLQCSSGTVTDTSTADTYNNKGFYVQASYKLTDQLSMTGGFRYTIDKARQLAQNAIVSFPTPNTPLFACQNVIASGIRFVDGPAACQETLRQSSKKPTWLIGLDYKPNNDMLIYAKYARGYRAGGMNSTNVNSSAPTWGPEKVDAYETGFKTTFRGAVSGNFNIAAFYNEFSDQQLSAIVTPNAPFDQPAPAGLGLAQNQVILNAGKSRIWGVEVEASVSPFEGLRLDASYAYLNTELISIQSYPATQFYGAPVAQALSKQECATAPDLQGVAGCSDLQFSPRNRVTLTANYTLPLSEDIGRITFGATYVHSDRNNSTSIRVSPNFYRNPPQDLVNLNVNWSSMFGSPIDGAFFMSNVTNSKDYVAASGGYGLGVDAVALAPPRMWGFRLRYNFGE